MAIDDDDGTKLLELKQLIRECKTNPSLLHDPSLMFFKAYLESLGARIPPSTKSTSTMTDDYHSGPDDTQDDIVESDIELDGEVAQGDDDPPQKMGDLTIEVSEDQRDAAQLCKTKATILLAEGKLEEAIEQLTEAVMLNPSSSILYATRAGVFMKMNKPNSAIRDADAALQINPDLAKGYKNRGMARAMLGLWEEAARDLHLASKLDYDEEIASVLKKVEPNVHKIEEHRRKYEHLWKEQATKQNRRKEWNQQTEDKDLNTRDAESLASDGTVVTINSSKELDTKLNAASSLSRLVILYFTASWCGPCRFMGPLLTNLAVKYPKVVFLKVDIDQVGSIAQSWNVSSVPTFFFVKQRKEVVDKVVGADKNGLEQKIEMHSSPRK